LHKAQCFALMLCGSQRHVQMKPINLAEKLSTFDTHWSPRIVGGFNGHDLMVVKVLGEFVWHDHPEADDFFMVLKGQLTIDLPDGAVILNPGEAFVVPKGVQHRPRADVETHLLLIEPAGTPNTGDPATAATKVRV
jgi:mannose-6-phosphate isomerase-like protein (cupin superfamily)